MAVTKTARIARKNQRIMFQKNTISADQYRNRVQAWENYFECFSYASTYGANESGDVVITEERSVIFEVRYCSELAKVTSTGYRIKFNGDDYDILSVDMMNYQKKLIRFTCRRTKR